MLNNKDEKLPIRALVAYNESEEIRLASSSGGIFTLCAKKSSMQVALYLELYLMSILEYGMITWKQ